MDVKRLAIAALRGPLRETLDACWATAREAAITVDGNTASYHPEQALDSLTQLMRFLRDRKMIETYAVVEKSGWLPTDWKVEVSVFAEGRWTNVVYRLL